MAQRLIAFLLLQFVFLTATSAAESVTPTKQPVQRTPESVFLEGQTCLKKSDIGCAQLALNRIPTQSAYAKILNGHIAAIQGDFDQAFRLLLPLQASKNLSKAAIASLHASLALAYENQSDTLRALEQYAHAEDYLSDAADLEKNDQKIWRLLEKSERSELVEIRGESYDTTIQGWIDLALAARALPGDPSTLSNWRKAYPDHAARDFANRQFGAEQAPSTSNAFATMPASTVNKPASPLQGTIALLLPFSVEAFYPASDAIERGFVAAQAANGDTNEIKIYATNGDKDEIGALYAQAVQEGAAYIVGPLTRDETTAIANGKASVITMALNQPDSNVGSEKFYSFGLSIEAEVAQIVRLARNSGMQSATIVSSGSPVASRTAKAFNDAWLADGGEIRLSTGPGEGKTLSDMKAEIVSNPADMIFIAANAEEARVIRPYLDAGTPTFGISHLYSGLAHDPADSALNAIRFVDLPWILDPESKAFEGYRKAAAELPPGEMQRWFALGVDAYALLQHLSKSPSQGTILNGLTGKLRISPKGEISRELAVARFSSTGVAVERSP